MERVIEEGNKEKYELQMLYVEAVRQVEQKRGYEQRLSSSLGSCSSTVALCLRLYSEGNRNELEKVLDDFGGRYMESVGFLGQGRLK